MTRAIRVDAARPYGLGRLQGVVLRVLAGAVALLGLSVLAPVGGTGWTEMSPSPAGAQTASEYHPVTPSRILDTRSTGSVGSRQTLNVAVAGRAGVPSAGATAVVMNLTVTNTTSTTFVTAWPSGASRPATSNLNAGPNSTIANSAIVKLGPDGSVNLWNEAGPADVIVDVQGWFEAGGFTPITPIRLLDSRSGARPGSGSTINVAVAGRLGLPSAGVDSLVVNLTVTDPPESTWITAWPTGSARPPTSSVNAAGGATVANLAVVKVGTGGSFSIYVNASAHVIVDVFGWNTSSASFHALAPDRVFDSRTVGRKVAPGETTAISVLGRSGVPSTGVGAVLLNVTATEALAATYWTVYPAGTPRPVASNLNVSAGVDAAALVTAGVGPGGVVWIVNDAASSHLIVDVLGWVAGAVPPGSTPPVPTVATTTPPPTTPPPTTIASTTPPTTSPGNSPAAWLALVNTARAQARVCGSTSYRAAPSLVWDARIETAARLHSEYQNLNSTLTHTGSGGSSAGQRMSAQGVSWRGWGENVAWNYPSGAGVLAGWLESPGHCANIMNPSFTHIGWARVGTYDTMDLATL